MDIFVDSIERKDQMTKPFRVYGKVRYALLWDEKKCADTLKPEKGMNGLCYLLKIRANLELIRAN